jgi:hypothetical protein
MRAYTLYTWIARHIDLCLRPERVCLHDLLFLMVTTMQHCLEKASRSSALNKCMR